LAVPYFQRTLKLSATVQELTFTIAIIVIVSVNLVDDLSHIEINHHVKFNPLPIIHHVRLFEYAIHQLNTPSFPFPLKSFNFNQSAVNVSISQ
jgi:hypothetical protein